MEDGQIGTVKFVDPYQEERCIVQLYVTFGSNMYTLIEYLKLRMFELRNENVFTNVRSSQLCTQLKQSSCEMLSLIVPSFTQIEYRIGQPE